LWLVHLFVGEPAVAVKPHPPEVDTHIAHPNDDKPGGAHGGHLLLGLTGHQPAVEVGRVRQPGDERPAG